MLLAREQQFLAASRAAETARAQPERWRALSIIAGLVVELVLITSLAGARYLKVFWNAPLVEVVYPVVLGRGKRVFEDGINLNLKLTQSTTSRSGVLLTTYQVA